MATIPHAKYVRHADFSRVRYSDVMKAFLDEQATRLEQTPEYVFETLMKEQGLSADQVALLPTPDPDVAPANTVLPAITGTTVTGQTLTVSNGTWTGKPAPTFARQWKRNGTNIASATGTTYVLVAADEGATITATVTATNSVGNASATSAGVGPVTPT